jgi:hypothetical protein
MDQRDLDGLVAESLSHHPLEIGLCQRRSRREHRWHVDAADGAEADIGPSPGGAAAAINGRNVEDVAVCERGLFNGPNLDGIACAAIDFDPLGADRKHPPVRHRDLQGVQRRVRRTRIP